jgi:cytochrome c-type biogenesis protein CcmI
MGLLTGVLGLPFAPLRATVWVAEQVAEEADRMLSDPAVIRRRLEELAEERAAGTIPPEQADEEERELVARLMRARVQARRGADR